MGIGVGLPALALGAFLSFAVDATVSGVSLAALGVSLMLVGAVGLVVDVVAALGTRASRPAIPISLVQSTEAPAGVAATDYVAPHRKGARRPVARTYAAA